MRNISWSPCLNTRLNLHISINCDKRAVRSVTVSSDQLLSNCDTLNLMTLDLLLVSKNITTSLLYTG